MTDDTLSDADGSQEPPHAPGAARGRWSRQVIGPFTLRHVTALLGTLAVVAVLLSVLTTPLGAPRPTDAPRPGSTFVVIGEVTEGLAVGQRAPELEGRRDGAMVPLVDLDGNVIRLDDLRGRPVWVNFWASWCPPCQAETPVLRELDERYRDAGLALVAVSVQETSVDDVRAYADRYDLGYAIGFDARSEVFKAWRGFGLPTHVFIDRDGFVRAVHYGPLDVEGAEALLLPLIGATATPTTTE